MDGWIGEWMDVNGWNVCSGLVEGIDGLKDGLVEWIDGWNGWVGWISRWVAGWRSGLMSRVDKWVDG